MAKNYVKKTSKKSLNRTYDKNPAIPGWFWLCTGLVIGFLAGGLMYLKNFHGTTAGKLASSTDVGLITTDQEHSKKTAAEQDSSTSNHSHSTKTTEIKKQQHSSALVNSPRFDFYTMLPKMKVGNDTEISQTDTIDSKSNNDVNPLQQHDISVTSNQTHSIQQSNIATTMASSQKNMDLSKNVGNESSINQNTINLQGIDPAQKAINRFQSSPSNQKDVSSNHDNDRMSKASDGKNAKVEDSSNDKNDTSNDKINNKSDSQSTINEGSKVYLVIVKGLQSVNQSDHLKAQLLLAGYDVKFEPVNLAGQHFNRIILGPFKTKSLAKQAMAALSSEQVSSEIHSLKVEQ